MKKHDYAVMCVDGDGFGLQLRRLVLESFGCRVLSYTSGSDALAALLDNDVDIVLMDVVIEGMPGGELARELKRNRPDIPVLVLSSLAYPPEDVVPFIDGFATKGEWPADLMQTIRGTVMASRGRRPNWLSGLAVSGARFFARAIDRRARHRARAASSIPAAHEVPPQKRSQSATA